MVFCLTFWLIASIEIKTEQEEVSGMIKWEVSIIELKDNVSRFKVTRRIPDMKVAETKMFDSKEEAILQFEEWTT